MSAQNSSGAHSGRSNCVPCSDLYRWGSLRSSSPQTLTAVILSSYLPFPKSGHRRDRIREQMREEMLECPVDAFLADYNPFLPDEALVDAAIQVLVRKQLLVLNERGEPGRWQEFDEEPRYSQSETKVFKPLQAIADVFDDELEGLDGRRRNSFYRDCPYDEVKSEIAGCNFRMDACFTDNPDHAQCSHIICSEIAVAAEFKNFTQDFEDNRVQLLSAASHIMNDDPCRMWMYGITIEDTEMAVWYFSRSHSVKSKSFNFMADIKTFIRVFLSFIYATREEMGYDPTVQRIKGEGEKLRYVYKIPTENGIRYFKTSDLIAHQRVICITGRKTRVWRAVEVKDFEGNAINEPLNGSKEVALKDVWLDDGSKTEKQNLDAIFERLRTIKEDAYQWAPPALLSKLKAVFADEGYKNYFMEIVCDSFDLGRSKGMSQRATPAPGILAFSRQGSVDDDGGEGRAMEDRNMLAGSTQSVGYNHIPRNDSDLSHLKVHLKVNPRPYTVKRQYRLVYEEVGESLDRVETLETAFNALLDTYIALVLMFLAGWMHRDVSAGNIIAIKRPGGKSGGKLSDLEYAKHCEDESTSADSKTGTAFFMPLEIHIGRAYKGVQTKSRDSEVWVDPFDGRLPAGQNLFSRTNAKSPRRRQPKYRFQHDLEYLWWVALYVLIYRVAHLPGNEMAKFVFTNTSVPSLARRELFEDENEVLDSLRKSLHPALKHNFILESMNAIPHILYNSYLEEPADPEALGIVYSCVFQNLAILVLTIRTEVEAVPFHHARHVQGKKRAHPEVSSKRQDDDEYRYQDEEVEEKPSSDDAVPKRKKKASTGIGICR